MTAECCLKQKKWRLKDKNNPADMRAEVQSWLLGRAGKGCEVSVNFHTDSRITGRLQAEF